MSVPLDRVTSVPKSAVAFGSGSKTDGHISISHSLSLYLRILHPKKQIAYSNYHYSCCAIQISCVKNVIAVFRIVKANTKNEGRQQESYEQMSKSLSSLRHKLKYETEHVCGSLRALYQSQQLLAQLSQQQASNFHVVSLTL